MQFPPIHLAVSTGFVIMQIFLDYRTVESSLVWLPYPVQNTLTSSGLPYLFFFFESGSLTEPGESINLATTGQ